MVVLTILVLQAFAHARAQQAGAVGRIVFSPHRAATQIPFVKKVPDTILLGPRSDLIFTTTFKNPITYYLRKLAPTLDDDSLHRRGNFRFTFLVDGQEVYSSELLPGAPPPAFLDTARKLQRALIDNENGSGSWSESFWNRFMVRGGAEALSDGTHTLRMEIRPYVQAGSLRIGELMASGEVVMQVALHPKIDVSRVQLSRLIPDGDLGTSVSHIDAELLKTLKGKIMAGEFRKINGIIVLRDGKILLEEYFNGSGRDELHDTRSVGKSFVSSLMGIAIKNGFLSGAGLRLDAFYDLRGHAVPDPLKASITLRQLLMMGSCLDGDDEDENSPGNEENMYPTPDWVKFALDLPVRKDDGRSWHYFTAGAVLLGDILNRSVPGGLEEFADRRLFAPIGIHKRTWQYTPQNVPNTAGGLRLRALDLARFGQLYKDRGVWRGEHILDPAWVDSSLAPLVRIPGREDEFYGYLFWNRKFKAGEKSCEASYCAGNGGNYVLIFKDQPLVVVITSSAYGMPYAHQQAREMLEKYILPAVVR